MDAQRQDDQLEPIYNNSVLIQDVALKSFRELWTIETVGERGSEISVLAAWYDDDIFLWSPSHGRAKVGRPAKTYIQQLYADTGCSLEDLPGVLDDRDSCWERVRKICDGGATWWWWFYLILETIPNKSERFYLIHRCDPNRYYHSG